MASFGRWNRRIRGVAQPLLRSTCYCRLKISVQVSKFVQLAAQLSCPADGKLHRHPCLILCLQIAASTCAVAADQGCGAQRSVREAPRSTGVNGTLMAQRVSKPAPVSYRFGGLAWADQRWEFSLRQGPRWPTVVWIFLLRLCGAENLIHGSDQHSCSSGALPVMLTGHVPAVRFPSDHATSRVAAAVPARGGVEDRRDLDPAPPGRGRSEEHT